MQKKNLKISWGLGFLAICILLIAPILASAEDGGGQVSTKAQITFYNETDTSSSTSDVKPKGSGDQAIDKKTRLPQTGEKEEQMLMWQGLLIIFIFGIACFIWQRDSHKEVQER